MPDGQSAPFEEAHYAPELRIGGAPHTVASRMDVVDPATAQSFGSAPVTESDGLDAAVRAAAAVQLPWAVRAWSERAERVRAFADAVTGDIDVLAHLLSREQGKPLAKSQAEVMGAGFFMKGFADLELKPEVLRDTDAQYVRAERRPIGVVGAITAWNYPVLLAAWKIAPAVLTGNAVIVKPAPTTPLSTLRLAQLADGIFPKGLVTVLTGDDRLGPWITSHQGIGKISFTGSIATGQAIMANASATLKRLTLELGGNDAAIVMPDFSVSDAAEGLFWSAFSNCGQVCAAAKRIYVPDSLYDAVCAAFVELAANVRVGPWDREGAEMGPLQNPMQLAKVGDLVKRATAAGARVIHEGSVPQEGYFYPLTVLADVTDDNPVNAEEQFGPVIALSRYGDLEDAIARANADRHGLGASVWGEDVEAATGVALRLQAGSVWVNQHPSMGPEIPFGGVKHSGIGVECGLRGLEEYTDIFVLNVKRS
ncbi:aldehyde dehydrogenase family protein [Pelagibius sp.]|uniref:aldehyde dehydrogenase family protein n=1 Tax=Pelagibius sp. TaxID=1931238 RepID=UPI003BB00F54